MISFNKISYIYPGASRPALCDVSLHLPEGAFALVAGPSGAGKSTLLRCVNGLTPHFSGGSLAGTLNVNGLDPVHAAPQTMSQHVGFVFQDPEAQFVTDQVEDEIAFALENAALPRQEMRVRVEEALDLLDLAPLRGRRLATLSGGEQQRVAIAAALALRPRILVLDEPTSQLDPQSATDVLHALARLNSDLGLTILLAEHRLERVLQFVDTLIYLPDEGAPVRAGPTRDILSQIDIGGPPLVTLGRALQWQPLPLTIKEGVRFSRALNETERQRPSARRPDRTGPPCLEAQQVAVNYNGRTALRGVSFGLHPGEIVALMGRNGAGKSTLLKSCVGLVRPQRGQIRVAGADIAKQDVASICRRVGYLPQDPNTLLFADTVEEELLITLRNHGLAAFGGLPQSASRSKPQAGDQHWRAALLNRLGLAQKAAAYPRDLSAGERQRVALGAIMVTRPDVLLLDEPTRGLDYAAKHALLDLLRQWRDEGLALLLVTHDVELAATAADRVLLMSEGEIIASGPPAEILGASPLFAPQIARLFPTSGWLTPEDVLSALPSPSASRSNSN
jgi:energy-coupling factor transport system ATP-binding protein